MCRLFVFAVCILLAYSIVEANRVKPVEKNERIAAKQHVRPAARNAKIDNTPDMIKKHDAKTEKRATRKHTEKTEKVIPKEVKKEKITRKHLEKTEKVIPKEVKKERIFHKQNQNKEKRKLPTVDIFAHVNKHAKKEFNDSTAGSIPTLEELMNTWDADTMAAVDHLVNMTSIELCVHHYTAFDDYDIGFVCEPGYCASHEIICDDNFDCTNFDDETPLLCDQPDDYHYPEYEWECAWYCITGYDPYTGEEMWGEITCDDECDGYMDCYYGEDEYCGGWYETFGCPIHVYDYWGKEYWMYTTIDSGSVCDGFPDCADGSDEEECYWYPEISYDWYDSYQTECAFDCWSGNIVYDVYIDYVNYIPCSWECDGWQDCGSAFDESYCLADSDWNWYSDTSDDECSFNCESGFQEYGVDIDYANYIPCYWECDGYNDCGSGSDEMYCPTDSDWNWYSDTSYDWYDSKPSECAFDCWSGNTVYDVYIDYVNYIPCNWECDGWDDCGSALDESYCLADSEWNWYSDTSDDECAFNCEFGYEEYGVYIDYVNYIPCYWQCDTDNDCGNYMDEMYCPTALYMDSYYKKSVDKKKSEEKKRAKISKGRQERASVRSNPNKKPSKKAKHGKQGKRHAPSVKKTENTVHHK